MNANASAQNGTISSALGITSTETTARMIPAAACNARLTTFREGFSHSDSSPPIKFPNAGRLASARTNKKSFMKNPINYQFLTAYSLIIFDP